MTLIDVVEFAAQSIVTLWIWGVVVIWIVIGATFIVGRPPVADGPLRERATFRMAAVAWILYAELRPFYLPAVAVMVGLSLPHHHAFLDLLSDVGYICWYWAARFPDDRWKRRRKRISERVKATVARLVVVSEEVPA